MWVTWLRDAHPAVSFPPPWAVSPLCRPLGFPSSASAHRGGPSPTVSRLPAPYTHHSALPTLLSGRPLGWRPAGPSPAQGPHRASGGAPTPPSTPVPSHCFLPQVWGPCDTLCPEAALLSPPLCSCPSSLSSSVLSASSFSGSLRNILEQLHGPHLGLASDPPSKEPLLEVACSLIPTRREVWGDPLGWTHWLWPPEGCPRAPPRGGLARSPLCVPGPLSPVYGMAFTERATSKGETEAQMGISGSAPRLAPRVTRVGFQAVTIGIGGQICVSTAGIVQAQPSPRVAAQDRPGPCLGASGVWAVWGELCSLRPWDPGRHSPHSSWPSWCLSVKWEVSLYSAQS